MKVEALLLLMKRSFEMWPESAIRISFGSSDRFEAENGVARRTRCELLRHTFQVWKNYRGFVPCW